jgi:hypothetical protein
MTFVRSIKESAMLGDKLSLEAVNDPAEAAQSQAQHDQAMRNLEWLESHWDDILQAARGKHVAVAGQEAFVADSPAQAWVWAARAHPEDKGAIVQYVFPKGGPRIYANRW